MSSTIACITKFQRAIDLQVSGVNLASVTHANFRFFSLVISGRFVMSFAVRPAVAQGQGRVPMTSITLALVPNSPTLQAVFFNASQDKENFSFSKFFEAKNRIYLLTQ